MDIKRTFLQDPQHNSAFMSYLSQQNSISFKLSTTDLYKIPQSLPPLPCQLLKGKENLNELSQSQSFQQSQAQTEFALYGQWQRDETAQTLRKGQELFPLRGSFATVNINQESKQKWKLPPLSTKR